MPQRKCCVPFAAILLMLLAISAAAADRPVFTAQLVKTGLYVITGEGRNSVLRLTANGFILVDGGRSGNYDALLRTVQRVSYSEQPIRALILTGQPGAKGVMFPEDGVRIIAHRNVKTAESVARITFDSDYRMHLGGLEVRVFHFGDAHTNGDAVVYFPVQKVVAVGDLYSQSPSPDYSAGGSLANWGAVLAEILKLDFDVAVPGTGAGVSRAELEAFKDRLDGLVSHARVLVREGVPKGELLAKLEAQNAGWRLPLTADQLDHFYDELSRPSGGPG
jgi:glyoxylase-like metal-dependent hydrolase (beta-lactamase superfamily II)